MENLKKEEQKNLKEEEQNVKEGKKEKAIIHKTSGKINLNNKYVFISQLISFSLSFQFYPQEYRPHSQSEIKFRDAFSLLSKDSTLSHLQRNEK